MLVYVSPLCMYYDDTNGCTIPSFGRQVDPGHHAPDAPSADVLDVPDVRRQEPVKGRRHRRPRLLSEALLQLSLGPSINDVCIKAHNLAAVNFGWSHTKIQKHTTCSTCLVQWAENF